MSVKRIMDPWIGDKYRTVGIRGRKILILGESSYNPKAPPQDYRISDHNRYLVDDAIGHDEGKGYKSTSRFNTSIPRMFGFDWRSHPRRREFWNSVAFYNFLQLILTKPRERPPAESWQNAVAPFLETLQELHPEFAICFGKNMWGHLPKQQETELPNADAVFARKAEIPLQDGARVIMLGFMHPSGRGFRRQPIASILSRELKLSD